MIDGRFKASCVSVRRGHGGSGCDVHAVWTLVSATCSLFTRIRHGNFVSVSAETYRHMSLKSVICGYMFKVATKSSFMVSI